MDFNDLRHVTTLQRSIVVLSLFGSFFSFLTPYVTGADGIRMRDDPSITIYDDEVLAPLFQHKSTIALFLGASGFGVERAGVSLISHATLDPYTMSWSGGEGEIDTQIVDLIGVIQTPEPRVYETMQDLYTRDEMPSEDPIRTSPEIRASELVRLQVPTLPLRTIRKHDKADDAWKVRDLDTFESQALKLLEAGHVLIWKDQSTSFRAVGAIRVQASCVRCHDDRREGELLGAFTYFGFKGPRPDEKDRSFRQQLADLAKAEPYSKEFFTSLNQYRHSNDYTTLYEWPIPEEEVWQVDRYLAGLGIVTTGMIKRQKALLADLPKEDSSEESASDSKKGE